MTFETYSQPGEVVKQGCSLERSHKQPREEKLKRQTRTFLVFMPIFRYVTSVPFSIKEALLHPFDTIQNREIYKCEVSRLIWSYDWTIADLNWALPLQQQPQSACCRAERDQNGALPWFCPSFSMSHNWRTGLTSRVAPHNTAVRQIDTHTVWLTRNQYLIFFDASR